MKPNSCGGCDARWTALTLAHCAACHLTFTGITAFDSHRRDGACRTPAEAGLILSYRFTPTVAYGHPSRESNSNWWRERQHE